MTSQASLVMLQALSNDDLLIEKIKRKTFVLKKILVSVVKLEFPS